MKQSKRYIGEMANMYGLPMELYTMNRGVKSKGKMRYDITIIPALTINKQYNKTKGHIHSTGHVEKYTVLEGEAVFFLQKGKKKISDCYFVKAKKGDVVIIPGDYYHITINTGKKTLKLANWLHKDCVSEYKFLESMNGMCYYLMVGGIWVLNKKYLNRPKIRNLSGK